jgi:hypothetical protein
MAASSDSLFPSDPTGLTVAAISSSQINLSWIASTDNVGITGYKIYRNGSQIGTSVLTNYFDTSLSASTSYTYTVTAYDAAGNTSAQSSPALATTQTVFVTSAQRSTSAPPPDNTAPDSNPPPTPVPAAYPTRLVNSGGTFYLVQNNEIKGITNPGILYSYGFEFKDALPATGVDLYLPAGNLLLPGNGALVKSKEDPTVYLISHNQKLGFISANVFLSLGFKWNSVLTVTNPELQALSVGVTLSDPTSSHWDGLDINDRGTIYWINSQIKHPYPSLSIFNSWHKDNDFSNVVPANNADLALPIGEMVTERLIQ